MSISVKKITFNKSTTTTGLPVSQAITGVGFQPKAALFFATLQTAFGSIGNHMVVCLGMTDGTTDFATSVSSKDNVGTSVCKRRHADKALTIIDENGSLVAEADLSSWGADGFTLSWTTNNNQAYKIHAVLLGGDDLTAAKVKTFAAGSGSQAVTGVGFRPSGGVFISDLDDSTPPANDNAATYLFGVQGSATSTEAMSICCWSQDALDTTQTGMRLRMSNCIQGLSYKSSQIISNGLAYISSWDSDGFTVNWTENPLSAYYVGALVLEGGSWKAKKEEQGRTNAGTQDYTGYGFQPRAVIMAGMFSGATIPDDIKTFSWLGLGAAAAQVGTPGSLDAEGAIRGADDNALGTANTVQDTRDNDCYIYGDTSTTYRGSLSSFDADGFTINWESVFSNTDLHFWAFAIGDGSSFVQRRPAGGSSQRSGATQR